MKWYVVSMDDIIDTAPTYREARQACLSACDDGRKHPDIKRIKPELYAYEQSSRYPTSYRKSYLIGTKRALETNGFKLDELGC